MFAFGAVVAGFGVLFILVGSFLSKAISSLLSNLGVDIRHTYVRVFFVSTGLFFLVVGATNISVDLVGAT